MREDAPGRGAPSRGSLPTLDTARDRDAALEELERDFHAASSRKAVDMKMKTIKAALSKWGMDLFPPSAAKIRALAAALKRGGYRSAESYLLLYRTTCERQGVPYSTDLVRVHRDCLRSCQRGLGGPVKALSLPFERLGELDIDDDGPWTAGGPLGPAAAIIAGSWFLTREVELSTTTAALVELTETSNGHLAVHWKLPASKSDQQALGVARTHGCACGGGAAAGCPYHAIKLQLARLRKRFPQKITDTGFALDLPLFPGADGNAVSKEDMVATILEAAKRLRVPTSTADGSERISGHSLRRCGAQGFARLGIDVWAIQLLGRWGGPTVLEYIQEVPLERSAEWARKAASALSRSTVPLATATSSSASSAGVARSGASSLPAASAGALDALAAEGGMDTTPGDSDTGFSQFVRSSGLIWHRVPPHGTSGPTSTWTTICGWRFARSDAVLQSSLPEQVFYKSLCKRCLPEQHSTAKGRC